MSDEKEDKSELEKHFAMVAKVLKLTCESKPEDKDWRFLGIATDDDTGEIIITGDVCPVCLISNLMGLVAEGRIRHIRSERDTKEPNGFDEDSDGTVGSAELVDLDLEKMEITDKTKKH